MKRTEVDVYTEEKFMEIRRLQKSTLKLYFLGTTAMIMNRMSKKAREHLLLPPPRMNRTAREEVLKHDPPAEFMEAVYRCRDPGAPTYIHVPNGSFKKAMANAALRIPGATKTEIGQLVQIEDETIHLYGLPFLRMDIVRQAGISKTPDIRTRACFSNWAGSLTVRFISSLVREQDIVNLMDAAGSICGIGDGRTEKGTFTFGSFELVAANDKRWLEVVKKGGREAQYQMMTNPQAFDEDTEELLAYFHTEVVRRAKRPGDKADEPTPNKRVRRRDLLDPADQSRPQGWQERSGG